MSGMLNTLLDINQIEAGTVHAEMIDFPISDLLEQLRDEFTYHAQAKGLALRVVPCSLSISSDPRLLEQMIRNLLSNALKYTKHGKVLLGCRRHQGMLSIEVWDTGIGIPDKQLQAIFEEYHQLDNAARERSRGLGLGLSIVHRLGALLGHQVRRPIAGRARDRYFPSRSRCHLPARREPMRTNVGSARETEGMRVPTAPARSWSSRTIRTYANSWKSFSGTRDTRWSIGA